MILFSKGIVSSVLLIKYFHFFRSIFWVQFNYEMKAYKKVIGKKSLRVILTERKVRVFRV